MTVVHETDALLAVFEEHETKRVASGASWTASLRRGAIEQFARMGFPTTREERWRTTSVVRIAKERFRLANGEHGTKVQARDIERASLGISRGPLLVFVNGRLDRDLSVVAALPPGVRITSLAEALENDLDLLEPALARQAPPEDHPFVALNTAFLSDGGFIFVPEGVLLEEPVRLVFLTTAGDEPETTTTMTHPRNLILAGPRTQVTVLESYAAVGEGVYFTNAVTEIVAGEGAIVEHDKVQREGERAFHIAVSAARLERGSALTSHAISLGGSLSRNEIDVRLGAEGAACTLNGLFLARGEQQTDTHTSIDHAKPECSSRELYKGILGGRARGVFDGKILVRPDARKTDARQVNRNLLLSEDALIDTTPQLEILNDDVKCSHAATIGRLDEEALFYLRSRGIDREAARVLLMNAFAGDVLAGIGPQALRRGLGETVSGWLASARPGREAA